MSNLSMLSVADARRQIAHAACAITDTETAPLQQARNRVLATDCTSRVDVPPADNSAMDGFAFSAPECEPPWSFPVSQTIAAGVPPQPLAQASAARIFTGAHIPAGADTVAMQENCSVEGATVTINATTRGANIRPRGQDIRRATIVVERGQVLRAAQLGLLAAAGVHEVEVVRAPRVAIINTGSELAEPGTALREGQIYNSNATMLRALCQTWTCQVVEYLQIGDDLEQTKRALADVAGRADLIITSGGVSVGDEDHVKTAVAALGQLDLWKVCMKPGKPLAFGYIGRSKTEGTPIIALPGNPVSSFVTAVLFVKAFINGLYGRPFEAPTAYRAAAAFAIQGPQKRPEFLRVQLQNGGLLPHPNQSSGVLSSLCWADALALIEPEQLPIGVGDSIEFYPLLQLTEL